TIKTLSQWKALGHDTHSLSATKSALFVNSAANDYHLIAGSPAIDTGTTVAVPNDMEGKTRPAGAGYDVGSYEAASGAPPNPPVINSLSPSSATAGGVAFTLSVNGSAFVKIGRA